MRTKLFSAIGEIYLKINCKTRKGRDYIFKASSESQSVRDNEGKVKKCQHYPCAEDFECPYPMDRDEPDCV